MTGEHFMEGMKALYTVNTTCTEDTSEDIEKGKDNEIPDDIIPKESTSNNRTYFIAAVEGYWNFAPILIDPIHNQSLLDPER